MQQQADPWEALKITDPKLFHIGQPFEKTWYNVSDKSSKSRLGKLYQASVKLHVKDKEKYCIARVIEFERISHYTIEKFEKRM